MERFKKLSERTACNSDQREQDQAIIYSDSFFLTNLKLNLAMKIKSSSVCSGRRKSQARAWFIELRIREEPEIDEDLRTGFEQTADFITVVINVNQRILVELLRHFLINFIFDGTEFSKQSVKLDRYLLHSVEILKIVKY